MLRHEGRKKGNEKTNSPLFKLNFLSGDFLISMVIYYNIVMMLMYKRIFVIGFKGSIRLVGLFAFYLIYDFCRSGKRNTSLSDQLY